MPATLEPSAAAPVSTGSALPPQPKEIQLGAPTQPSPPPKPGSPREAMRDKLRGKAGVETPPPKAPEQPKTEAPKPEAQNNEQAKVPESIEQTAEKTDTGNAPDTNKEHPSDSKKVSPWKLVDQFKQRALAAEQRALELEKQVIPETERTQQAERYKQSQARLAELEEEIRYVNYTKSAEFKEKHLVPYERAWHTAMKDLNGLTFQDQAGNSHGFDVNKMMELVSLDLPQARQVANTLFGDLANDVMNHRNRIKGLMDEQNSAIEEARKTGATREQQRAEQMRSFFSEVGSKAKEWWEGFNQEVQKHPEHGEFVKPKEGNEEWNTALEKGFEMAKKAFSVNVTDHRLTPEQRKEAVKLQSALYNKAAAYGPMRLEIKNLRKQLSERESELGKYKQTTPSAGGQTPQLTPASPQGNSLTALHDRLRSRLQR